MEQEKDLKALLAERFQQLPEVVKQAITSTNVEKHLRSLATEHKLHVDQWESLENEVMLTLLGFEQAEHMADNLQEALSVSPEVASALTESINRNVFEPIREELERQLEHPHAKEEEVSDLDAARHQVLAQKQEKTAIPETPTAAPEASAVADPQPATPPPPKPEAVVQAPDPAVSAYKPGEPSSRRKEIADDPYREPIA